MAVSSGEFTSRTWPGPGVLLGGTSSSPVEITPTFTRRATGTLILPMAASAPISWAVSTRPAGRISLPGNTSSPRKIRFIPGAPGFMMPTVPSP